MRGVSFFRAKSSILKTNRFAPAAAGRTERSMKIIDAHAHIFPEKIAQRACGSISDFYGGVPMAHAGTAEALLASGAKAGVEKYLVFSTATKPEQVESINRFIVGECEKHPEFIGLGTMHPGYAEYRSELEWLRKNGIRGIKLHPDFQKFCIDDAELYPLYALLSEMGMFVLTHSGDDRYDYSHPARIARVAENFPHLRIIAAHFGGWRQWDAAVEYLNLPNVYYDTSSTLSFAGQEVARKALRILDSTHFFFGTDFPMWDHADELKRIQALELPAGFLEDILYNNFYAFMKQK